MPGIVDGESLYAIVTSTSPHQTKLDRLADFKTHVKRDFVDLRQVPRYFEALSVATDASDPQIASVAFLAMCHLVKRVSMQDRTGVLAPCAYLVLPLLLAKLVDLRNSLRVSAKKALEAYWLVCPSEVAQAMRDSGLAHTNTRVRIECLAWLQQLVEQPRQNTAVFRPFVSAVVVLLGEEAVREAAVRVLASYVKYGRDKLAKLELQREMQRLGVERGVVARIMGPGASHHSDTGLHANPITINTGNAMAHTLGSGNAIGHTPGHGSFAPKDTRVDTKTDPKLEIDPPSRASHRLRSASPAHDARLMIPKRTSHPDLRARNERDDRRVSQSSKHEGSKRESSLDIPSASPSVPLSITASPTASVASILAKLPGYPLDTVTPIFILESHLHQELEAMTCFQDKETEFNWSSREKAVLRLRGMLRGNIADHSETFILLLKSHLVEGIGKAVMSLRTTLSTNGCQLVKELGHFCGAELDSSLVEHLMLPLFRLSSATKKIASMNAHLAMCGLLANCAFHSRVLAMMSNVAAEKNTQPRLFLATWLQILLVRFGATAVFDHNAGWEAIEGCMVKCLSDPNPAVREQMRTTFWVFYQKAPVRGEALLASLRIDVNVKKALDRSKPKSLGEPLAPKARPSVKEFVARNKEELGRKSMGSLRQLPFPAARLEHKNVRSVSQNSQREAPQRLRKASIGDFRRERPEKERAKDEKERTKDEKERVKDEKERAKDEAERTRNESPVGRIRKMEEKEKSAGSSEYDPHNDPIVQFLSSSSQELKAEGVNLLKYAVMGDEVLSAKVNQLLMEISLLDPFLLQPLFGLRDLLPRVFPFFTIDNFMRVLALNYTPEMVNVQFIATLAQLMSIDDFYLSIYNLMSYTIDIKAISNKRITMQVIKYKLKFVRFYLFVLTQSMAQLPLNDEFYLSIVEVLFRSLSLLKSLSDLYEPYTHLLRLCFSMNPQLFQMKLLQMVQYIREEIHAMVSEERDEGGVPRVSSENEDEMIDGVMASSLYEMTMVNPRQKMEGVPGFQSDMTMIVPKFHKSLDKPPEVILSASAGHLAGPRSQAAPASIHALTDTSHNQVPQSIREELTGLVDVAMSKRAETDVATKNDAKLSERGLVKESTLDIVEQMNRKLVGPESDVEMNETLEASDIEMDCEASAGPVTTDQPSAIPQLNDDPLSQVQTDNEMDDDLNHSEHEDAPDDSHSNIELIPLIAPSGSDAIPIVTLPNLNVVAVPPELSSHDPASPSHKIRYSDASRLSSTLSQVQISCSPPNTAKIQRMIEMSDPFVIATRKKPVEIYHDRKSLSALPDPVSALADSWFDFGVEKLAVHRSIRSSEYAAIGGFERICRHLGRGALTDGELVQLLTYMQAANPKNPGEGFHAYYASKGVAMVRSSVQGYFREIQAISEADNQKLNAQLRGLILLKQLLLNRDVTDISNFWDILVALTQIIDADEVDMTFAIEETRDEMINLSFLKCFELSIRQVKLQMMVPLHVYPLVFLLATMGKCAAHFETLSDDLIVSIDEMIEPLLSHHEADVRRFAIMVYAQFHRLAKEEKGGSVTAIMSRMSSAQRKLVKYYSER
ncbi:hypothetical protein BABINDRAFT_163013 [Babjeviella inositovora NRRL Y-12698]|uniref:Protein STU1 n=1 Tax=Babjeviella inositovora NRRL Y-12698 TaxID=984486 RepID=A0A1E3QLK8_9ASCO|nr:uncharacterized protein BABINDRAFT_163013 [Babjeviella inositovora NRRL Y-12698]ODQ77962.1 hypothetical protein BABINDRAFT_163013 [Babjeviella inositovora NRRL Y-12698]